MNLLKIFQNTRRWPRSPAVWTCHRVSEPGHCQQTEGRGRRGRGLQRPASVCWARPLQGQGRRWTDRQVARMRIFSACACDSHSNGLVSAQSKHFSNPHCPSQQLIHNSVMPSDILRWNFSVACNFFVVANLSSRPLGDGLGLLENYETIKN